MTLAPGAPRSERVERQIGLKIPLPGAVSDARVREQVRREAPALFRLNHPDIATVLYFDNQDGIRSLVVKHVAGEGMEEKIAADLPEKGEIARLESEPAEGIAVAHGQ